jgi:hypothetical protein
VLISASCTTGWTDVIIGELWLCPDGLLRRSSGLRATVLRGIRHGGGATVDPLPRPVDDFDLPHLNAVLLASERNIWIPWALVECAEIRRGLLTESLRIQLRGGRRVALLWLAVDHGAMALAEPLRDRLGERFLAG